MSIKQRFKAFYFGKKKYNGSRALAQTFMDMAKVISELDDAISETRDEENTQDGVVVAAQNEQRRLSDIRAKGETFLAGLRDLFGIAD